MSDPPTQPGSLSLIGSARPLETAILRLAADWAESRSKDPNSKVGAVVYDPVTGGMFFGYNGFLSGDPDLASIWTHRPRLQSEAPDERDLSGKYAHVIHAERNAIKKAVFALGENIGRCTLYVTHFPCLVCIRDWVCLFGIKTVVYATRYPFDPVAEVFAQEHSVDLYQAERSS